MNLLKSFTVFLICGDSSDSDTSEDEAHSSSIQLSKFVYTILEDSQYIFHPKIYPPDIQRAHFELHDIPQSGKE
jgi:hypothetical protein